LGEVNKSGWYRASDFKKHVVEAVKNKKTEWPIEDPKFKHDCGWTINATWLVDLERKSAYGMKLEMKTNTGNATEYLLCPELSED